MKLIIQTQQQEQNLNLTVSTSYDKLDLVNGKKNNKCMKLRIPVRFVLIVLPLFSIIISRAI